MSGSMNGGRTRRWDEAARSGSPALLRPECGNDDDVRAAIGQVALPAAQEPDGRLVGPLAVVEQDHRGPRVAAQRVEEMDEHAQRPRLAELLRAEHLVVRLGSEQRRERRQDAHQDAAVGIEMGAHPGGEIRVAFGCRDQVLRDPFQELERASGRLVDALATEQQRISIRVVATSA